MSISGGRAGRARRRSAAVFGVAAVTAAALLVSGCGSNGSTGSNGSSNAGKNITIKIDTFGNMGFNKAGLFAEYHKLHPNVTIKENTAADETTYWRALQPKLSTGQGLGDVVGLEVGRIRQITDTNASLFSDMSKAPGFNASDFYSWKLDQAKTKDGKLIGIGTDIGPMAVCYRADMFKQAGLPTDRDAVAKLWAGGWDQYVATGATFQKQTKDKSLKFMDTANGVWNSIISGAPKSFYDESGKVVYKTEPTVKQAYDLAAKAAQQGETAKLLQFQTNWQKSFSASKFASIVCPSWMLGLISQYSGKSGQGKWDIAAAPASANWGGSFLAVPENSPVKAEAQKFVAWLTNAQEEAKTFANPAAGNFPSNKAAAESDTVKNYKNPYFNNAPVGQIFAASAAKVPSLLIGPKSGVIKDTVSQGALARVEQRGEDPAKAWKEAQKEVDQAIGQ